MKFNNQNITFEELDKNDLPPYELLLLADPSKELVDEYLNLSDVFVAKIDNETVGAIVLSPLTNQSVEIKNVAVTPALQGKGIGKFLIENLITVATRKNYKTICIGTANSSIGQLYLYQKLGFEITEVRKDFFIKNYPGPIYENGIQAKHMIMLTRQM